MTEDIYNKWVNDPVLEEYINMCTPCDGVRVRVDYSMRRSNRKIRKHQAVKI